MERAILGLNRGDDKQEPQELMESINDTRNTLHLEASTKIVGSLPMTAFKQDASKTSAGYIKKQIGPNIYGTLTNRKHLCQSTKCLPCKTELLAESSTVTNSRADERELLEDPFSATPREHKREPGIESPSVRTIFRVRQEIRDLQPEAFIPEIVGFGIYHNGMHSSSTQIWKKKLQALCITAKRLKCATIEDLEDFLVHIETLDIENWYRDSISLSKNDLAWNFSMDACYIIEFYRSSYWFPEHEKIMRDIFKLENQIPLFLLKKILELEFGTSEEAIFRLAKMLCMQPQCAILPFSLEPAELEILQKEIEVNIKEEPCHLLNLLSKIIEAALQPNNNSPSDTGMDMDLDMVSDSISFMFAVLSRDIDVVQEYLIRFKPSHDGKIKFRKGWFGSAVLFLPKIYLFKDTESLWWNLIAFSVESESNVIGNFISLMSYIITERKNIGLLRKRNIILSEKSNDELYGEFHKLSKVIKKDFGPFEILQNQLSNHYSNSSNVGMLRFTCLMLRFAIFGICILFLFAIFRFAMRW